MPNEQKTHSMSPQEALALFEKYLPYEGGTSLLEEPIKPDDTRALHKAHRTLKGVVEQYESLSEQLEALQREYAASREISKWALETKRCDEPSPQGDMLCDREPGHEGVHVNWQAAEWSQTSSPVTKIGGESRSGLEPAGTVASPPNPAKEPS